MSAEQPKTAIYIPWGWACYAFGVVCLILSAAKLGGIADVLEVTGLGFLVAASVKAVEYVINTD